MNANYIVSTEYDGKKRKLFPQNCVCGNKFYVPKHLLNKPTYCSRKCSDEAHSLRVKVPCAQCGKTLERRPSEMKRSKHRVQFCDRKCKELSQSLNGECAEIRPSHYGDGHTSYRKHVTIDKCVGCGDNRILILLVHHIDGNRKNNKDINLEVVCPSCHAIRHLQFVRGIWQHNPAALTPRELLVGFGTAWGGHLTRNEEVSGVQIPEGPPKE